MYKKILALSLCALLLLSGTGPAAAVSAASETEAVSRAEAFQALYQLEGEPMVVQMLSFPDTAGAWYAGIATWAKGAGLSNGDENGAFQGDRAVTRAELVTILYRYAQWKGLDVAAGGDMELQDYDDAAELPAWSAAAFVWACGAGLLAAKGTALAPADPVSAAELQEVLSRLDAAMTGAAGTAETGDAKVEDAETGDAKAGTAETGDAETGDAPAALEKLDMTRWSFHEDDQVYYQLGVSYCASPADADYETLAVFVPAAYLDGVDNGDGSYTCTVSREGSVNGYTAATAPIVLPVNTPGYSAMAPLSAYTSLTEYMEAGFVYVHAGCRGRDHGAPAGVTDLKAALRFLRWNDQLPGDTERIFTFGMSGGGAQSALMGATGDSALYAPYLTAIGAVEGVSDAVAGSMCWCPITNLESADEAYEWMMGVTRSSLSEEEQAISDALAEAFAAYVNEAGIPGPDGTPLTLSASEEGIFQAGSYYDYILSEIERSLNNFLADTAFPYDGSAASGMGGPGGFGGPGGGNFGGGPGGPGGAAGMPGGAGEDAAAQGDGETAIEQLDNISRTTASSRIDLSGTYETAQDYIDAMNAEGAWVSYDAASNTASVASVEAFVKAFKPTSKSLAAFDQLDAGQGENTLFGYGDGSGAHFDATLAGILEELGSSYAAAYAADLQKTDALGKGVSERLRMYSPLYYLLRSSEGFGSSAVAKYWRIRTGIAQSDTAVTTEVNLALALQNCDGVEDVDFEMVWGQQHTQAERSGNSSANFIAWVNACLAAE